MSFATIIRAAFGSRPRPVPDTTLLQVQAEVRQYPLHGYRHATAEKRARKLLNERLLLAAKQRLSPAKFRDLESRLSVVRGGQG